jgi:hypothetical protein
VQQRQRQQRRRRRIPQRNRPRPSCSPRTHDNDNNNFSFNDNEDVDVDDDDDNYLKEGEVNINKDNDCQVKASKKNEVNSYSIKEWLSSVAKPPGKPKTKGMEIINLTNDNDNSDTEDNNGYKSEDDLEVHFLFDPTSGVPTYQM